MRKVFASTDDFMKLPIILYRSIGLDPYESNSSGTLNLRLLYLNIFVNLLNTNFTFVMEFLVIVVNLRKPDKIIDVCMTVCYVGYIIVSEMKSFSVVRKRTLLTKLMRDLESIFPPAIAEEQQKYRVDYYVRRSRNFLIGFSSLFIILTATYAIFYLVTYVIYRLLGYDNLERIMPFYYLSPWDYKESNWGYVMMYISQCAAAYTATIGHVAADILIFAVCIQFVMHFDYLCRTLSDFKPVGNEQDLIWLRSMIAYHNKLLSLCEVMNNVFGIALLLNMLTSSVTVCNLAFQMTLGLSTEHELKLFFFLICTSVEIYLICYFSNWLTEASSSIAAAVYDMHWFDSEIRFRKMLILISMRAQNPVMLKATVFLDITMETMTMFLQTSYKLFCLIRTMYQ